MRNEWHPSTNTGLKKRTKPTEQSSPHSASSPMSKHPGSGTRTHTHYINHKSHSPKPGQKLTRFEQTDANTSRRTYTPKTIYVKQLRNQYQSRRLSERLLKHLAPLWEVKLKDWIPLLERRTATDGHTLIFIVNTEAISANIHNADNPRPPNNLDIALPTLKATLALPANHERRKLPKDTTRHTQAIHES